MGHNVLVMGKNVLDHREVLDIVATPSGALATATKDDVGIAEGKAFLLTGTYEGLATDAVLYMLMDGNGVDGFHFHDFKVNTIGSPVLVEFFESPTVTVNGTAMVGTNQNRLSTNTATALTYIGSTVTDDGTFLGSAEILGVTTSNNSIGEADMGSDWVLDPAKLYIFKFTNGFNQAVDLHFNFQWHEHEA